MRMTPRHGGPLALVPLDEVMMTLVRPRAVARVVDPPSDPAAVLDRVDHDATMIDLTVVLVAMMSRGSDVLAEVMIAAIGALVVTFATIAAHAGDRRHARPPGVLVSVKNGR
jgi:hypothetical protein